MGRVSAIGPQVSRRWPCHASKAGRHARLCAGHPRLSFSNGRKAGDKPSAFELRARDAFEIAMPDLLLVGGWHIDLLDDAKGFARVRGALFGIERAVGGEHDLVEIVESKTCVRCRH